MPKQEREPTEKDIDYENFRKNMFGVLPVESLEKQREYIEKTLEPYLEEIREQGKHATFLESYARAFKDELDSRKEQGEK